MSHAAVDLLLLWHHHQPDYRSPRTGRALLPWARLHASKDYLAMALHLERHPTVRATFNFVPVLLDQLDDAVAGGGDALFDLLARPASELSREERLERVRRTAAPPPRLVERWPEARRLAARAVRAGEGGADLPDAEADALAAWYLIAWIDPLFHVEPAVKAALADGPSGAHLGPLLELQARLLTQVLPAYRRLAARGQVELSASPYAHPILPLLVDTACARRAQPDLPLPAPGLAAPEDAARQVERALQRHAAAFGAPPRGLWPSEGAVSPEVAGIVAARGLRWLATDEGVLWRSLETEERKRGLLYQPWRFETASGAVSLFFRDHELSDRIGFVYANWDAAEAVADFLGRLRRIGGEHGGEHAPLVTVALDGENCWEHYAGDGGPFLEALYAGLAAADDIRTVTPSQVLEERGAGAPLAALHSGSWIDADFHVWIGHPEKNAAWERIARARGELLAAGADEAAAPEAWHALHAAEGSDWFWWFGTDHETSDRPFFDALLREHLAATWERRGAKPPGWVLEPIVHEESPYDAFAPIGFLRPVLDGRETSYYEWRNAGVRPAGAGSSMHRGPSAFRALRYGFDERHLYLRLDPAGPGPYPGGTLELTIRSGGTIRRLTTDGAAGDHPVRTGDPGAGAPSVIDGARCVAGSVIEIAIPYAAVGLAAGDAITVSVVATGTDGGVSELEAGADRAIRITAPGDAAAEWSA